RLSPNGTVLDKPIPVASLTTPTLAAPITLTPSGFVVVFDRGGKLWIRELDFAGNPVSIEASITDDTFYFINGLRIVATPNKARFLVYWHGDIVNGLFNIYGQMLSYKSVP